MGAGLKKLNLDLLPNEDAPKDERRLKQDKLAFFEVLCSEVSVNFSQNFGRYFVNNTISSVPEGEVLLKIRSFLQFSCLFDTMKTAKRMNRD